MIKIEGLKIKYPDGNIALNDVTIHINEGDTVAIIGANGAGKSTLLMSLVGIVPITEGTVMVDDLTLEKSTLARIRQKIGLVFQNPDDQLFMTHVYEDIAFGPRNYGAKEVEVRERVEKAMKQLDIKHLARRLPSKLSGGEKRMVAIAGVLAMDPVLMLFDEPTSFLDPKSRRNLLPVFDKLPITKVIATHDLEMAAAICNRVIVLQNGRVVADGTPDTILNNKQLLENSGL
jgi:cobalt/nickel transport system ATP-binding protein